MLKSKWDKLEMHQKDMDAASLQCFASLWKGSVTTGQQNKCTKENLYA
jgi:hypothetical protein